MDIVFLIILSAIIVFLFIKNEIDAIAYRKIIIDLQDRLQASSFEEYKDLTSVKEEKPDIEEAVELILNKEEEEAMNID